MSDYISFLNFRIKKHHKGRIVLFVSFQISNRALVKDGSGVSVEGNYMELCRLMVAFK